jgi:hypothetical protein
MDRVLDMCKLQSQGLQNKDEYDGLIFNKLTG